MHIVLVEDDEVIRETTQLSLERFGYTVTAFEDGREGYEFVALHGADAVLLDLMLPTMNGASITRAIRERSTVPIIIVSARSEPIDIVQALEAGADDYLTKPFDMQVLNARIRAVVRRFITAGTGRLGFSPSALDVRREDPSETLIGPGGRITSAAGIPEVLGPTPGFSGAGTGAEAPAAAGAGGDAAAAHGAGEPHGASGSPAGTVAGGHGTDGHAPSGGTRGHTDAAGPDEPAGRRMQLGSLVIDTGRLTVEIDGTEVHLTPTELRILMLLTEEPGHVYSREKMAYTVWGYEWAGDSRVVDVHIQRLRKKIGAHMIETVRGFGYRFAG
ncbi:response regulator transcription factor [Brevibacterium sp.]|uniref:response regulator transcription factor n=1 Tax=Brevibacterium sp. TaxID=1701 RepID=UPI0025B9EF5E|nr:response regulator transcription factor [Brevibacterium sp.]